MLYEVHSIMLNYIFYETATSDNWICCQLMREQKWAGRDSNTRLFRSLRSLHFLRFESLRVRFALLAPLEIERKSNTARSMDGDNVDW